MERGGGSAAAAAAAGPLLLPLPTRRRAPPPTALLLAAMWMLCAAARTPAAAAARAGDELQYCPFFNNRGTSPQNLNNCTWYANNSCCRQVEIDNTFSRVKPPQGAGQACLDQLNYLMCYICDPRQYTFYRTEYLAVCEEFCDNLYAACRDSVLKGSVIGELYSSGRHFCQSRRFVVRRREAGGCFYYDGAGRTSAATRRRSAGSLAAAAAAAALAAAAAAVLLSSPSLCMPYRLAGAAGG